MSTYDVVKFAHILGVIGLFAGSAIVLTAMIRMRYARTIEQQREWSGIASGLTRLVPGTIGTILLPGVYMTHRSWAWDVPWIVTALVAYLIMLPLAPAINARRLAALHRAVKQSSDGPPPADVVRRTHDPILWTSVQTMTLVDLGIVFLMVTKPGVTGSITTMAVAITCGALLSVPRWRGFADVTPLTTHASSSSDD
ncbi:MAG TPA: DUF2269 family protein [Thermomicrobiales bacterium]|nr:DUF2269 family protein [Thermomicrobiales bacterium]